ncbi:hypothetical protein RRG08_006996 [Elysia crispata]|uniref:Lipase maturation factor 2 n=1 Tax=Elysia crispata TaxID=231223 RepID=A0AAE1A5U5_9GAST|nr:hypothetical protein RRG08_006996 [Elysia crispata]
MTGNYNFFNLLTITLCIGLLDDNFCMFFRSTTYNKVNSKKSSSKGVTGRLQDLLRLSIPLAVVSYIVYMTVKLFALSVDTKDYSINSKIMFSKKQFYQWLEQIMPITIYMGVASLSLEVLMALLRSVLYERGMFRKALCTAGTVFFSLVAVFMFTISLVPHSVVNKSSQAAIPREVSQLHSYTRPFHMTSSYGLFRSYSVYTHSNLKVLYLKLLNRSQEVEIEKDPVESTYSLAVPHSYVDNQAYQSLPKYAKTWHSKLESFEITNSYGLFRTMTGVGGRPEIILEGHPSERSAVDGWRTYNFLYKPGNMSETLAVVAPHQPRLDWQMWFAALGNYQNNPWFLHLVYRLLQGEPDVLELLSPHNPPFPTNGPPPMFVRATLYHYHYTSKEDCAGKLKCNWWKREKKAEYLPSLALTDKSFVDYLKQAKLITSGKTKAFRAENWLAKAVVWSRDMIGQPEGFQFTFSMFGSSILAMFLNRAIF